jgi:23S rRNA (guanosine2251-2'-O)-methyltransferase
VENKKIIYGRNSVLEYLRQIKTSDAVLHVSNSAHGKIIDTIIKSAKGKHVSINFCGKDTLYRFEPSSKHQGVILELAKRTETVVEKPSLQDFLTSVDEQKGVLVLLDQLTDPHNVGSIILSTEALGGQGIILTRDRSAGITPIAEKTSSGATAYLPIYTVPNASSFLDSAKETGFWIIGTSGEGNFELNRLKEYKPCIIVIGSEGAGMRNLTEEKCDFIAAIPLLGNISSLNAAVAAGIVLYEALKK